MNKHQKGILWLFLTLVLGFLAIGTVSNSLDLPVHDKARDVVSLNYDSATGQDIATDIDGKVVCNWQANNLADDILKFLFVASAIFEFWKLLGIFISYAWLKMLI